MVCLMYPIVKLRFEVASRDYIIVYCPFVYLFVHPESVFLSLVIDINCDPSKGMCCKWKIVHQQLELSRGRNTLSRYYERRKIN
jgi:hypothetical protein